MIFIVIIITIASGVGTGALLASKSKGSGEAVAGSKTTANNQAAVEDAKSADGQKQSEEDTKKAEEQKKAEENKAVEDQKKAAEAKQTETAANQNTNKTKPAESRTKGTEYPKGIVFATGVRIVESKQQDDAKTGVNIISSDLAYSAKSNNIKFKVGTIGANSSIPYKATIHLKSGDVVYKGTTSNELQSVTVATSKVPVGSDVSIDFEATYKGKVYKFENSFVRSK